MRYLLIDTAIKPDRMPKPKTELNKRLRRQRKDAGLVEFRGWVTPEQKKEFEDLEKQINGRVK